MKIPANRNWTQLNQGWVTGVLHTSRNIALDAVGQLQLARRPVAIMSSDTDANFSDTVAILHFDSNIIAVTDDRLFAGDLTGDTWSEITAFIPNTTVDSDAIVFNDRLVVTINNNVADWDGDVDDKYTLESLTASVPHPMAIFDSQPTYKLAIGNGNTVKLLNTSYSNSSTNLTIPSQYIITSLAYRNGYLYVATKTTDGSEARIFIWNGNGAAAQYEVPIGSEWVYSIIPYGTTVAAITNAGQLLQISGTQVVELAALPVYHQPHARWQGATSSIPRVYHRGMTAIGNTIYINLEGELDEGFMPEMKSGVWVFDPQVGLYHRAQSSTDTLVRDNSISVSGETLTTSAAHNLLDGDAVQFRSVSGLTNIEIDIPYYVTVVSTTEIKLSLSKKSQILGKYVTFAGTPGGSDVLFYFPNTDRGSGDCRAGAIAPVTINETSKLSLESEVIWGSRNRDEAGNTVYTLNVFHDSNTVGSFSTQRIYSPEIESSWRTLHTFVDNIENDYDKLIFRAQTRNQSQTILLDGVWADETTLNSAETGQFTAWSDFEIGDEVVIYDGYGQGRSAHIVEINNSSLTYSLTLDESIGTTNGVCKVYRSNYKKFATCTNEAIDYGHFSSSFIDIAKSPWVSIEVEMRGMGIVIDQFNLPEVPHKNK